jgi:hypothetical protein
MTLVNHFYAGYAKDNQRKFHDATHDVDMCLLLLIALLEEFPFLQTLNEVHQYFFIEH